MSAERAISAEDSIKVVCRFRPLNYSEKQAGSKFIVEFPCNKKETYISIADKMYSFDNIFLPTASQEKVYNEAAKSIVADVVTGYNGTIFAYGQTSSGKTHTMEGVIGDHTKQGIMPRIVNDIFKHIHGMEVNLQFHIKVSYYEIYMEKIRDLLDVNKSNLSVHEDKDRIPYVKGTTERFVTSPEEVFEIMEQGKSNRHVAVTNTNEHSSRSHSVFLINVKQENLDSNKKLSGKLFLIDLAGSEKVSKTGAKGSVLEEAKNINKSLWALGNVIAALADENKSHIPYRDSKLTRILQESLGGNSRTMIVICCSPSSLNASETKSTLEFGKRAKTVKNFVRINEELTAEEWKRRYEREQEKNARLKVKVEKLEAELARWRAGEIVSVEEQEKFNQQDVMEASTNTPNQNSTVESKSSLQDLMEVSTNTPNRDSADEQKSSVQDAIEANTIAPNQDSNVEPSAPVAANERLYRRLDIKDDAINEKVLDVETLKDQVKGQGELIANMRRDNQNLQTEMARIQQDNQSAKQEVKRVLRALEELAVNYDRKSHEIEMKNQEMETLFQEFEKLKAAEQQSNVEGEEKEEADQLRSSLSELKDVNQKVSLPHQPMTVNYEKFSQEAPAESLKLPEVTQNEKHDQIWKEVKGSDDIVARELHKLHSLRKLFVQDLKTCIRKSINSKDDDGGLLAQKQKFLKDNLDQLTKAQKPVSDTTDICCELRKLEKLLKATMNRVEILEKALQDAKDGAMRDRQRYQMKLIESRRTKAKRFG